MESKNTVLLRGTDPFMHGDLDNVTVVDGRILLDMVQGAYVPYGCYTSQAMVLPAFDALRMSWNADTPEGTAVEAQARVMVDGNWTAWMSFGRWGTHIQRTGAKPATRGPLVLEPDALRLDSKTAVQAQLRIYLYTKQDKATPAVRLLCASIHEVDVIPAGGRSVHKMLHLMPYVAARRAPARREVMDLAICLASLTNRWGADILPEEFAQVLWDHRPADEFDPRNLSFAAAAAGAWGFPAWVCWCDLALLRSELRAGYGAVVLLDSTPAQQQAGLPPVRCLTLRGLATAADGTTQALLCDPWAGDVDFDAEITMPMDEFLVAWNNLALLMRPRSNKVPDSAPQRRGILLRHVDRSQPELYRPILAGEPYPLPDDFCEAGGILAWSTPDEMPHATTAHRTLHFAAPENGCVRLPQSEHKDCKCTVYAIDPAGDMLVGDVTV